MSAFQEALNSGRIMCGNGCTGAAIGKYFQPTDILVLKLDEHNQLLAKYPEKTAELSKIDGPQITLNLALDYVERVKGTHGYIQTNSFTHPLNLRIHYPDLSDQELESLTIAVMHDAVQLAKEAAGENAFVAVSLGPPAEGNVKAKNLAGKETKGISLDEVAKWTGIQAAAALSKDPDVLNIETVQRIDVLKAMVNAAKKAVEQSGKDVPIMATMTFDSILTKATPENLMDVAKEFGLVAIGVNCMNFRHAASVMHAFKDSPVPVIAKFNIEEGDVNNVQPEDIKNYAASLVALKTTENVPIAAIGGCCNMMPKHIGYIAQVLDALN